MIDNGKSFFRGYQQIYDENKLILKGGTIVDATIISVPTSTNNEAKQRAPEMHSTKKRNQWYFGIKCHI